MLQYMMRAMLLVETVILLFSVGTVTSYKSIDEKTLEHNHVIDSVLKTLNKKPNETMERNKELFCYRKTYRTDLAIGYQGCASFVVEQGYCAGQCSSIYLPDMKSGALSCSMCEVTKRRVKSVKLHCQNGVKIVDIPIVEECGCRSCPATNNIPEPPWKKRKGKKNRNKSRERKNNKNKKGKSKKHRNKRKKKLRNKRKLREQRKQMRLMLLRAQASKQRKRAPKHNKQVFTYDDLMKMMFSLT